VLEFDCRTIVVETCALKRKYLLHREKSVVHCTARIVVENINRLNCDAS
jgi:hypothetical protein